MAPVNLSEMRAVAGPAPEPWVPPAWVPPAWVPPARVPGACCVDEVGGMLFGFAGASEVGEGERVFELAPVDPVGESLAVVSPDPGDTAVRGEVAGGEFAGGLVPAAPAGAVGLGAGLGVTKDPRWPR